MILKGATVVSITSKVEMEFLTSSIDVQPVINQIWIGLEKNPSTGNCNKKKKKKMDKERTLKLNLKIIGFYGWHDGSSVTFTSFAFATQSQTCVYMYSNAWYDAECLLSRRIYVCKRPKSKT